MSFCLQLITLCCCLAANDAPGQSEGQSPKQVANAVRLTLLLAQNDIQGLPPYFSFWHSESAVRFVQGMDKNGRTFDVVQVVYPVPQRGHRCHSFVFRNDGVCLLHTADDVSFEYGGLVDFTGDGILEKIALYPDDVVSNDRADVNSVHQQLRVWKMTKDNAVLLLDAEFRRWVLDDPMSLVHTESRYSPQTKAWEILLTVSSTNFTGTIRWSREKHAFLPAGFEDADFCLSIFSHDEEARQCPMGCGMSVKPGETCPLCGYDPPRKRETFGKCGDN